MKWPRTILLILCSLVSSAIARDPDWNQFRGGLGDGTSQATGIPSTWSETKHVAWKTPIWGKAWSSPVIWKQKVWLTTATEDGRRLAVICLDIKTGKILHDKTIFTPQNPQYSHPFNSYASPTPFVEAERVYIHFGSLGTACLDSQNCDVIWKRDDLPCDHFRGPASSVFISGHMLYLPFDGSDVQYVAALDKRTGKTIWRTDRKVDFDGKGGAYRKAFSTARMIRHEGKRQLVVPAAMATMSYEPATGHELWRVTHGGANVSCPPLFRDGVLYLNSGDVSQQLMAVRPDGSGDVTSTHVQWTTTRGVPSRPSILISGQSIYMVSNMGIASCVDVASGKTRWTARLSGKFSASPVLVRDRIICCEEERGVCHVFAANPERFHRIATNTLDNSFMASPAVSDGVLLLRSKKHLYAISR